MSDTTGLDSTVPIRAIKDAQKIAELTARCEAQARDAARYRWLRERILPAWFRPDGAASYPYAELQIYLGRNDDDSIERFGLIGKETKVGMIGLDEAVDHAMSLAPIAGRAEGEGGETK